MMKKGLTQGARMGAIIFPVASKLAAAQVPLDAAIPRS
jgi:hypothetical protein